jgi:hypothetical protein
MASEVTISCCPPLVLPSKRRAASGDYQPSEVLTYKRQRRKSKSSSGSNPITSVDTYSTIFSSSLLLLHIDVLMKLQLIFFSGTLQVEYGSLTVMHVAVLIIVMVLA